MWGATRHWAFPLESSSYCCQTCWRTCTRFRSFLPTGASACVRAASRCTPSAGPEPCVGFQLSAGGRSPPDGWSVRNPGGTCQSVRHDPVGEASARDRQPGLLAGKEEDVLLSRGARKGESSRSKSAEAARYSRQKFGLQRQSERENAKVAGGAATASEPAGSAGERAERARMVAPLCSGLGTRLVSRVHCPYEASGSPISRECRAETCARRKGYVAVALVRLLLPQAPGRNELQRI